jgi:hypothetical protein
MKEVKRCEVVFFFIKRRKELSRVFTALDLNCGVSVGVTAFM